MVDDCKLTMEISNGHLSIKSSTPINIVEALYLCGALERTVGYSAYNALHHDIEAVKTLMLDVHLGAMDDMSKNIQMDESENGGNDDEKCL